MKKWMWFLSVAALVMCAAVASATTVRSLSLEELTAQADLIVQARVVSQHSFKEGPRGWIYTASQIEVVDSFKGKAAPGDLLLVRQLGGQVEQEVMTLEGNAQLNQGEEVILFLDRDEQEPQRHYVVGLAQGKYSVDRSGAQPVVRRNQDGTKQPTARPTPGQRQEGRPLLRAALPLSSFKSQLQGLLAR